MLVVLLWLLLALAPAAVEYSADAAAGARLVDRALAQVAVREGYATGGTAQGSYPVTQEAVQTGQRWSATRRIRQRSPATPVNPGARVSAREPPGLPTEPDPSPLPGPSSRRLLPLPAAPPASPGAGADLVVLRSVSLQRVVPRDKLSVADEPSVANRRNSVFYTGNWYAASSSDGGYSWTSKSPYEAFPSPAGPFCCDQMVVYDPGRDLMIWGLLYSPDRSGNNAHRIAVAADPSRLETTSWLYWDLTAQLMDYPSGYILDYPQAVLGANSLYVAFRLFDPAHAYAGTVMTRFNLNEMARRPRGLSFSYVADRGLNFMPAVGAPSQMSTMYWAAHIDNTTLRVYAAPEDSTSFTYRSVPHSAYRSAPSVCLGPDDTNMCRLDNDWMKAGWVSDGVIGFMWDAAQGPGGLGSFPYPYVHVVRIDQSSMAIIDEPVIWSPTSAWAYPALAVNRRGGVGVTLMNSGGANHPSAQVVVWDDLSPGRWQGIGVRAGTNGPNTNQWGDFLTVRPASGNGNTWVASSFTLQGRCDDVACGEVEPLFFWFGRQRDATPEP